MKYSREMDHSKDGIDRSLPDYVEKVSSTKTEVSFIALSLFCLVLLSRRARRAGFLRTAFLFFFSFFTFYAINFRTLLICITADVLTLNFGIFTWYVPLENIASCHLDKLPAVMRLGGAGIHFMVIRKRYRASFNFLEYPRVVVLLNRKKGLVQEISFSTRRPREVLERLQTSLDKRTTAASPA